MAEEIGLTGVMDLSNFDKGMDSYLKQISKANDDTEKTAGTFSKSFNSMGQSVNSVAGTIGKVLVGATAGAAVALGSFAVKGITQAKDMDTQLSAIAVLLHKTTAEVQPLSAEIVKLSLDPTLAANTQDAADAIAELAKQGLSMDQIMGGAAKNVIQLANATGAGLGESANLAKNTIDSFNLSADDMGAVVDGIAGVVNGSELSFEDYAAAINAGGAATKAMGFSLEDFNTILVATSDYTKGGADSANQLKIMMQRLTSPSKAVADEMKKLGIHLYDAKGVMLPFPTLLKQFENGLSGMTEKQKNQELAMILGNKSMREMQGLLELGSAGYEKLQKTIGQTSASDQAAQKMQNLQGVIKNVQDTIDGIGLAVGNIFLPMITQIGSKIGDFLSSHSDQFIGFFKTVADVISALVSGTPTDFPWEDIFPPTLAAIAYGVAQTIEGIGKVVADMRSGVFNVDYPWEKIFPPGVAMVAAIIAAAIQFVSDHLIAFEGALAGVAVVLGSAAIYAALGALGAAIAAISLPMLAIIGVAALLGAAWASDWGGIQELVLPIVSAIGVAITDVGIVIKSFTEDVPGAYPWETIFPPWLALTMHWISYNIQGVQTVIDDFHNGVFGYDYPWSDVFPEGTAQLAQATSDSVQKVIDIIGALQATFEPLTTAIQTNGAGALTEIQAFATGNETSFENVTAIWNGLTATAQTVFNGIAPIVTAAYDLIVAAFAPWGEAAWSWIATAITNAPTKLMEWYTALVGAVTANLVNWGLVLTAWSDPLVDWVDTALTNLPSKISGWYTALTTAITGYLSQWLPYLVSWSDPLVNWIETAITNLPAKIGEWYTSITGAVTGYLGGWVLFLTAWSDPLVGWIDVSITNIATKIGAWFTALQSSVAEQLPNWIAAFPGWVDAAVNWLGDAGLLLAGKVGEYMASLLPTLAANLPTMIASFLDWAAAAVNWITNAMAALPIAFGLFIAAVVTWIGGDGLNGIVTAVTAWAGAFIDWVDTDLIPKVAPAMGRFLAELYVGMGKVALGIVAGAALISAAIFNTIMHTDWNKVGEDLINLLIKGIKATVDAITALAKSTAEAIAQKFKDVDWNALGVLILTKIQAGFSSLLENMKSSVDTVATAAKDKFLEIDWEALGKSILTSIQNGIVSALNVFLVQLAIVTTAVTSAWTSIDWAALGTAMLVAIGDAAVAAGEAFYTKLQTIIDAAKKKFTDFDWKPLGQAIIDGIKAGIEAGKQALWDKVNGIVDAIKQKIKDALGIGSPAKTMIPYGKAIVDGLIVGVQNRQGALFASIQNVISAMNGIISNTITRDWFPTFTSDIPGLKGAREYSDALDEIISLSSNIIDQNPDLASSFKGAFDQNDAINASLKSRIDLLEIMRKYNLDPGSVLGGQDINSADPKTILQSLQGAANQIAKMTNAQLYAEQFELKRLALISQLTAQFGDQVANIQEIGSQPMNFFSSVMFQQAKAKFDTLTDQINTASQTAMAYGATQANQAMINLATQRKAVLDSIKNFQANYNLDTTQSDLETSVLQKQLTMLDQAKKLGWDLSSIYTGFFHGTDTLATESLRSMAFLENALSSAGVEELKKQVAQKALLDTLDTSWNISGIASSFAKAYSDQVMNPLLANLKNVVLLEDQRAAALAKYNKGLQIGKTLNAQSNQLGFLNDQIALLKQVADAGLDIKTVFAGALNGQDILGSGANINSLLTISNQLMDSLVKKAQDQLTPQAVALAAQQQQVDQQKSQLDLLNRQLDIIHQGQSAGVNWEGFFSGLTTGLNASETDILTATSRLYKKLIKQALDELGIHSPSSVMMAIGEKASAGLGIGFAKGFNFIGSMLSTIPTAPISNNRTLSFNMGGVNIYNGMDEMMLESKIMGIMERRF